MISAANYVARRYGVHSAMPAATAHRLCPHGVYLHPRIGGYAEVSRQIREIFERFTPLVEPLSLDEAFLDVAGSEKLFGSAAEIGRIIKQTARDETGLVVSGGASRQAWMRRLTKSGSGLAPRPCVGQPPFRIASTVMLATNRRSNPTGCPVWGFNQGRSGAMMNTTPKDGGRNGT